MGNKLPIVKNLALDSSSENVLTIYSNGDNSYNTITNLNRRYLNLKKIWIGNFQCFDMLILFFRCVVFLFLCIFAKHIVDDNCLQHVEHDKETLYYIVCFGGCSCRSTRFADLSIGGLYDLFSQSGAGRGTC